MKYLMTPGPKCGWLDYGVVEIGKTGNRHEVNEKCLFMFPPNNPQISNSVHKMTHELNSKKFTISVNKNETILKYGRF